jgi:membrane-bound lytic murein transglycosylase MltF
VQAVLEKPFVGDFDELVKRRAIRVGVTFNRTHYFVDKGQERGLAFESLKAFEKDLNAELKTGNLKVNVVLVPLGRDQLYPALTSGMIDMVAAMVTVTPEREKLVAFSVPTRTNVSEVVVTGPGAPAIATLDDLAGQEVFVRKGSIYAESLAGLNEKLKARGKPPVVINDAPEVLEDEDVLEMVNAGLVKITVVDDHIANFWKQIFTSINVLDRKRANETATGHSSTRPWRNAASGARPSTVKNRRPKGRTVLCGPTRARLRLCTVVAALAPFQCVGNFPFGSGEDGLDGVRRLTTYMCHVVSRKSDHQ